MMIIKMLSEVPDLSEAGEALAQCHNAVPKDKSDSITCCCRDWCTILVDYSCGWRNLAWRYLLISLISVH